MKKFTYSIYLKQDDGEVIHGKQHERLKEAQSVYDAWNVGYSIIGVYLVRFSNKKFDCIVMQKGEELK